MYYKCNGIKILGDNGVGKSVSLGVEKQKWSWLGLNGLWNLAKRSGVPCTWMLAGQAVGEGAGVCMYMPSGVCMYVGCVR